MTRSIAVLLLAAASLAAQQRRAPSFALPDSNFQWYDLQDYRGKVVLLTFIRTDCPTCHTLLNVLAEVNDKVGGAVRIVYIVTPPDTQTTVAGMVKEQSMRGPVLFDCGQVAASYTGATAQNPTVHLPHLFIIDKEGTIRSHASADGNPGELLARSITAVIEDILGKPKAK